LVIFLDIVTSVVFVSYFKFVICCDFSFSFWTNIRFST